MKFTPSQIRIGIASVIILGTIGYLAVTGAEATKSYYVTVAEMQAMGEKAYQSNLRVEGYVKPATITKDGANVSFILTEFESHNPRATAAARAIRVDYKGSEPPPDTFKGDAQALAIGTWGRDGVFHATGLQAKCASKYAPAAPGGAGKPAPAPLTDKRATLEPGPAMPGGAMPAAGSGSR